MLIERKLKRFTVALALAFVLGGCGDSQTTANAVKPMTEFFAIKVGDRSIRAQIAVLPAEMEQGLMGRSSLGTDEGMLFVYMRPAPVQFWMRQCVLPLDIGYFDADGLLKEIYPMYPNDERPVPSRSRQIQFALEMNQGWFHGNSVKPGAKLDREAIRKALAARGFEPDRFGLKWGVLDHTP